jgi:acyl-CoA synthetase (NDP forming)
MADMAQQAGLTLAPLSQEAAAAIEATVPPIVSVSNPLDYHTFAWRDRAALARVFAAMLRVGADLTVLILDFPTPEKCDTADWDIAAAALGDAVLATGRRAAVLATLPECMPQAQAGRLVSLNIVPLFGMAEALEAIAAASDFETSNGPLQGTPSGRPAGEARTLPEFEGKRRLAAFGVTVPAGSLAASEHAAAVAADALGYPVALKAAGDIAHKTELGAVRLNLNTADAVRAAATALLPLTGSVLVERMVSGCIAELIVGVARDAVLGHYLILGSGGILAELVGDTATLLLPATRTEIATALDSLRISKLMRGFRGKPRGDMDAVLDAIDGIQKFALRNLATLHELDVNPLMVRAAGEGAVAADVLMRLSLEPAHV